MAMVLKLLVPFHPSSLDRTPFTPPPPPPSSRTRPRTSLPECMAPSSRGENYLRSCFLTKVIFKIVPVARVQITAQIPILQDPESSSFTPWLNSLNSLNSPRIENHWSIALLCFYFSCQNYVSLGIPCLSKILRLMTSKFFHTIICR